MSEWQPISTYDKLNAKPPYAVFWFRALNEGRNYLPAILELRRVYGHRVCTHWMPITEPKEAQS